MTELLRCTDQWGRIVILSEECWQRHILREHAILKGRDQLIVTVLTNPQRMMKDAMFSNRRSFYRQGVFSRHPKWFLKVCVDFEGPNPEGVIYGQVVTAYPTQRIKQGETQLWP